MKNMNIDQKYPYHSIESSEAIEKLQSSEDGLGKDEVKQRRKELGRNVLPEKGSASILKLILKQFKDFLVLILFIAAVISYFTGHMVDVYVIIGVILVNAAIGFFQEYKAEKSIQALKKLIKHSATVLRGGEKKVVEAPELVPGDIIFLDEGKSVPADARLIEVKNFTVNESSLTGESIPVGKEAKALDEDTNLADRKNMIYKGTHVTRGSCKAVVTATGKETELGKIAESLQEQEDKESEFRKKTRQLAKIMAGIAIFTSLLVFSVGYFLRDFAFNDILLVTIASLVSAIPEGLPAVLSIVLAIGANRMAKKNAIIREFTATETAGSLNVILTDKTGTITQSVLTVKKLFVPGEKELDVTGTGYNPEGKIKQEDKSIEDLSENAKLGKMALISHFCHDASLQKKKEGEPEVSGDPTEVSLLVFSRKTKLKEEGKYDDIEKIDDLPFNAKQKFRASLISYPDKQKELLVVGAPEKLLDLSTEIISPDGSEKLKEDDREMVMEQIDTMTKQALRVIACGYRQMSEDTEVADADEVKDIVFTGLFGIIDPARPEVAEAVERCNSAGIRVVMVTGDHKQTAAAIAREVGIIDSREGSEECPAVLSEDELDVDDETFEKYTSCVNVFARVSPQSKLRIAKSLQEKKHLIGMTGDGVNDAPALKTADVGIAMGQRGTDVAQDASQIVLSDDNFASIVNAVKEGRIVFRNVRLTSFFLVTTNFASALTLVTAIAAGFTYPLLPTQILWINLVTDGIMDISLATEPDHGDIMDQKPQKKGAPILNKQIFPYLFIIVPVMVGLALLVFNHYYDQGIEKARTGVFLVVAMTQVFNAYNLRSLRQSAFKIGFFKNKWVIIAFFASIILQLAAIKLPFMQDIFHFRDIEWIDIVVITALSSLVFIFGELFKFIRSRVKSD